MPAVISKHVKFKKMEKKKFILVNILVIILMIILIIILLIIRSTPLAASENNVAGYVGEYNMQKVCYNNLHCEESTKIETKIYYQTYDLFKVDNLEYRGNVNLVSLQGKYYNYQDLGNIIFVGEKIKNDYKIKSGDTITIDNVEYTVIDNKSNCNDFTNEYCVEILGDPKTPNFEEVMLK